MKVILLRDVPKVGKKYEVKEVASGYAENALFRKGLAEPAIPKNLEKLKKMMDTIRVEEGIQDELLQKNLEELKEKVFVMQKKANDSGHLFSKIHAKDISELLSKQYRIELSADMIDLEEPIKTTGKHEIQVKAGKRTGSFLLEIEGEK